jgi:hypothetical protein
VVVDAIGQSLRGDSGYPLLDNLFGSLTSFVDRNFVSNYHSRLELIRHNERKTRKPMPPRLHRTRIDPFADSCITIEARLQLDPTRTAKDLMVELVNENPAKFQIGQRRTLQRRVAEWWQKQNQNEAAHRGLTIEAKESVDIFSELTASKK